MGNRIHRLLNSYIDMVTGHQRGALIATLLLFLAAIYISSGLALKSDLKELLPPDYQSVKELNRALERIGGVGSLIVVAQSPNPDANKKFMDDLASAIDQLPDGLVRYYSYRTDEVRKFYEDHFLYFIDVADLEILHDRLKRKIDYEKFKRTPLFLDLEDGQDDDFTVRTDDIKDRNKGKFETPVSTFDDYYGGDWGRMLIMVIRPYGETITLDSARTLVSSIEGIVDNLNPKSFDPGMSVGFCGNVKSTIEEYETLKHDILSTALLCVALVAAALIIYFLRVRVIFILGLTLLFAVACTFALTRFVIGYLNAQTAFLGSIIVGTGINYGIILVARYIEERKKNLLPPKAMKIALNMTLKSTFLAMATTMVSFMVLLIARIRGLSQFGFIGATGVFLCWLSTVLVLPIFMLASERVLRLVKPKSTVQRKSAFLTLTARLASKSPIVIVVTGVLMFVFAVSIAVRFAPNSIEYDFTKMRNKVSVDSGTEALEKEVSKLFKNSMTPSVVLVERPEQGLEACNAVDEQNMRYPPEERRVGTCHSIYDLLPKDQDAKLAVMKKIDALISQVWVRELEGESRDGIDRLKKSILGRAMEIEDLPDSLTRHFDDLKGNKGSVVFVNPRPGMLLSDGRNLIKFADTIRDIHLADGTLLHAASPSIVFSDLIKIIKAEAPILTLASFFVVVAFVLITLRGMKLSFEIIVGLIWSIVMMIGVAALMDIKINFFNFIVLPLTFGIGVDYSLNIAVRLRQEGPSGVANALRKTGLAVVMCSATTTIGYFVLTVANNQALVTFGQSAVIGDVASLIAGIFVVPATIVVIDRWFRR